MAKTYRQLYPQIYGFENLYQAHRQARRGGKRKRPEVAEFEHNLGESLLQLQDELQEQTYRPRPYRHFIVIERKERRYMSLGQYEHISGLLAKIGQQLGGWRKTTEDQIKLTPKP